MLSANFFEINDLGLFSSLLRFSIFFIQTAKAEFQSVDFELSSKRIIVLLVLLFLLPILIVWNHFGFFLDDIFYPDWNKQTIEKPLFIVGNARSGTTWLHRLIALDEGTFTTFRTWEIIFGVSVTWRILIIYIYDLDQRYSSGILQRLINHTEQRLVGGMTIHQVGLQEVEEDEWLMTHVFMSQLIMLLFPLGGAVLYPLVSFDKSNETDLPMKARQQIFRYYKECVQRHLYVRSNLSALLPSRGVAKDKKGTMEIVFLSKNPPFTMRLELLYDTFPSCRVACLLRDPIQSVPSMISYIAQAWEMSSSPRPPLPTAPWTHLHNSQAENESENKLYNEEDKNDDERKERKEMTDSKGKKERTKTSRLFPKAYDLLGFCIAHYTYPLEYSRRTERGEHQWSFVPYRDLLGDVEAAVLTLLRRFKCHEDEASVADVGSQRIVGLQRVEGEGVISVNSAGNGKVGNGSSDEDINRKEKEKEEKDNYVIIDRIQESRVQGPPLGSRLDRLTALLKAEKLLKGAYVSNHYHSVEDCCCMTEDKLRELLRDVYLAHPNAF